MATDLTREIRDLAFDCDGWEKAADVLERAADRIEALEAENERLKREKMLASGSGSMMTTNWAYVCGKLAAATGSEPHMETMPAGYQGTYCRGYDEQKGWDDGTTLKMVEAALPHP